MTTLRPGDLLLSPLGDRYRVVEYTENVVSLMRVDGYTLFSCNPQFLQSMVLCPEEAATQVGSG